SVPTASAVLRRALGAAGVPVATASNELPLARQRAAAALLLAMRAVTAPQRRHGEGGAVRPVAGAFTADDALALVAGPVGGADPIALRRLRRGIRRAEFESGSDRDSVDVIRAALADGAGRADGTAASGLPRGLSDVEAAPLLRARTVLEAGREALRTHGGVEEVLWALWQASGLEQRSVAASARGGPAGVQADRDLDAVVALFDAAADFVDGLPAAHPSGFVAYVEDQELPGKARALSSAPADAVTLLSAHSAVG